MEEQIKASELRIGNYVLDKVNGLSIVSQLGSSINKDSIGAKSIKGNYWGNNHLPVPLTEKWLLDFGSIKKGVIFYDRFRLNWREDYKFWYVLDKDSLTYLTKIEFVHEWQNFVFTMNGNELTLKKEQ